MNFTDFTNKIILFLITLHFKKSLLQKKVFFFCLNCSEQAQISTPVRLLLMSHWKEIGEEIDCVKQDRETDGGEQDHHGPGAHRLGLGHAEIIGGDETQHAADHQPLEGPDPRPFVAVEDGGDGQEDHRAAPEQAPALLEMPEKTDVLLF